MWLQAPGDTSRIGTEPVARRSPGTPSGRVAQRVEHRVQRGGEFVG